MCTPEHSGYSRTYKYTRHGEEGVMKSRKFSRAFFVIVSLEGLNGTTSFQTGPVIVRETKTNNTTSYVNENRNR